MSTRPLTSWPAKIACAMTLVACSSSDEPSGPQGSAGSGGVLGDAGGAPATSGTSGTSGNAGLGGSNGGTAQAGTSGGGQVGGGMMCGIETCSGTRQCCPSTGKCFDPSFEGCGKITCKVTSTDTGGSAGAAANCCPNGLLHCAATEVCYHAACVGCCS